LNTPARTLFRRSTAMFGQLWKLGIDFALPWRCLLCNSVDEADIRPEPRSSYCRDCRHRFAAAVPDTDQCCQSCGAVLGPHVSTVSGCVHCRDKPLRFDSVSCLGMYDETIRDAILPAKYSASTVGLAGLSRLLVQARRQQLLSFEADVVIPVPHHWRARLTRHFNSAAVISEVVAPAIGVPVDNQTLFRSRLTRLQKRVDLKHRFENQKGAFGLRHVDQLKGKRVLLVDDVLTTGATCSEAARLFKTAGVKACHVAVIARVLDPSA